MNDLGGSAEPVAPPESPKLVLLDEDASIDAHLDAERAGYEFTRVERRLIAEIRRLRALARAPQGDPPEPRLESVEKLAPQWRNRARDYRDQQDMMLPNRAGQAERDSLLWRARAYETCAEELQLALSAKRVPAPQGDAAREQLASLLLEEVMSGEVWREITPASRTRLAHKLADALMASGVSVGGASSSGSAPPPDPEKFRRALQKLLYAHGEWAQCRRGDLQRESLADAAVTAENVVVALYEEALGLDRGSPTGGR